MRLHPGYEKKPEDPNFIDVKKTPLDEGAIAYYLREAWRDMHGSYPSENTLAIAWSQTVLETGRNARSMMRNNNFGNIKLNLDYSPCYTSYKAGEFLNGKHELFYSYHPQTMFAAWRTPLEGAFGYLTFLSKRKRYTKAWVELTKGNTVGYVRELKAGGYFTAPLDKYTAVVVRLTNEFKKKHDKLMQWTPPTPEPEFEKELEPIEVVMIDEVEAHSEEEIEVIIESPIIEEPVETLTDLVPLPPGETKLNYLIRTFHMIWSYVAQMIARYKK